MRIGVRLSKAAMPVTLKNPMILPKDSHISKLILRVIHQNVGHPGRNHMLSLLKAREKRYIFNNDLNSGNEEAVMTDSGNLFHSLGPATAKAQSPLLCKQDRGTSRR